MRINKFLASAGLGSRRSCEKLVIESRVTVNGKVVNDLAFIVSEKDKVKVDGKIVALPSKFTYLMMHKPKGYVCTLSDDRGRKTVKDLLPLNYKYLKPIGRLDYDSEGLLLFTNDGLTAEKIMSPANEVAKVYSVKIEGELTEENKQSIENGIKIEDGICFKPCTITIKEIKDRKTKLEITLVEGKNREIRKIFEHFGYNVIFLKRVSIGEIRLGGLTRGTCRLLRPSEIEYLKSL